ncbi:hypothetical protein [Pseudomonas sp. GM84]|uniref:hypothetical protein n=1 Tax=Pseudomonas sp. GM84 TaxID=1144340 RepID=UPI0012F85FC9|nr:hypothetical protein [Pseudomonas sp. GM84]
MEAALVADLLSEHGLPLEGDGQSDELIVQIAWANNQGQPFYVVRDWLLLDIMVPSDVEDDLKAMGLCG